MSIREKLLHAALFSPTAVGWGLPILFESAPGAGKTSIVRGYVKRFRMRHPDHAELIRFPFECFSGAARGEGAYGVVPVPREHADGTFELDTPPPAWAIRMNARGAGLVFLDELSCLPPILQAPSLSMLTDRFIAGLTFVPRVRILGAANPPGLASNGHDFSASMANRLGFCDWPAPSPEEHRAHMMRRGATPIGDLDGEIIDVDAEESRVLAAWPTAWARAVGIETAFLSRHPEWKNRCPREGDEAGGRAWPSDRSWENATCALASAMVHGLSTDDRDDLIRGFVGNAAFEAFSVFVEYSDLPDTAAVLDGQAAFEHNNARIDRTAVFINSAMALVSNKSATNREPRARKLWSILDTVGAANLDVVVPVVQDLHRANLGNFPEAIKLATRIYTVTNAK